MAENGGPAQTEGEDQPQASLASGGGAGSQQHEKEAEMPAQPEMPQMKLSQLAPIGVYLALRKWDPAQMGYRQHCEFAFALSQALCLGTLGLIYAKISKMKEDGIKIAVPEVRSLGIIKPAMEWSKKDYDRWQFIEQASQAVLLAAVASGLYYKWDSLTQLVLQIVMTPVQLYESPLFKLHILGKTDVQRPFPDANPFGRPKPRAAPAAPAVEEEKKKDK